MILSGCSTTHERQLSKSEIESLGLKGRLYDVQYCPTRFDEALGKSIVTGPCELVTCVPASSAQTDSIKCKAKSQK